MKKWKNLFLPMSCLMDLKLDRRPVLQQNDGPKEGGIKPTQEIVLTYFGTIGHFIDMDGLVVLRSGIGCTDA